MRNIILVLCVTSCLTCFSLASAANCNPDTPFSYHKDMVTLVNMTDALIDKTNEFDDRISIDQFHDLVLKMQGIAMNAETIAKNNPKARRMESEIRSYKKSTFTLSGLLREYCQEGKARPGNPKLFDMFVRLLKEFRGVINSVA